MFLVDNDVLVFLKISNTNVNGAVLNLRDLTLYAVQNKFGILSPDFFSVYIDDLIKILRASKVGCHVLEKFIACILFADDMSLISPSRSTMQKLLDLCTEYCTRFCLKFNVKKLES